MSKAIEHVWTPLAAMPRLWLAVAIAAYLAGRLARRMCGDSAFASPVLIGIVLVAAMVLATGASYPVYFAGAQFINFLLGAATIALAIPLAKNLTYVRSNLHSIGLALLAGSVTSIVSGVAIVRLLGGSRIVALSMAPKAVATPRGDRRHTRADRGARHSRRHCRRNRWSADAPRPPYQGLAGPWLGSWVAGSGVAAAQVQLSASG